MTDPTVFEKMDQAAAIAAVELAKKIRVGTLDKDTLLYVAQWLRGHKQEASWKRLAKILAEYQG